MNPNFHSQIRPERIFYFYLYLLFIFWRCGLSAFMPKYLVITVHFFFQREGLSKYNKIFEFECEVGNQRCQMLMTSVLGHLLNYEFPEKYTRWYTFLLNIVNIYLVNLHLFPINFEGKVSIQSNYLMHLFKRSALKAVIQSWYYSNFSLILFNNLDILETPNLQQQNSQKVLISGLI